MRFPNIKNKIILDLMMNKAKAYSIIIKVNQVVSREIQSKKIKKTMKKINLIKKQISIWKMINLKNQGIINYL